jgi:hypothetical protein
MLNAPMMESYDSLISTVTQLWAGWSEVWCLAHQLWGWYSHLFKGSQGKVAGIQSWLLTTSTAEVQNKCSYSSTLQGQAIQSWTVSPLKKNAVWSSEMLETLIQQQSVTSSHTWNLNYTTVRPQNPTDIYL